jgi:hypothetical protein
MNSPVHLPQQRFVDAAVVKSKLTKSLGLAELSAVTAIRNVGRVLRAP